MKTSIRIISLLTVITIFICGCTKKTPDKDTYILGESDTSAPVEADFAKNSEEMFSDRDFEIGYDESTSVIINLNGNSVESSSNSVTISETTVTITEEATYIISGTLNNGQIIVNASEAAKPHLIFKGASISCSSSAPLYIKESDKVFITLAEGTENTLSCGDSFTAIDDTNIDSSLFSKQDLTLNGQGKLTVTSPVGHGIVCKDDLVITGGIYEIAAASHGIDANDSTRLTNASVTIDAGKDGIHVENTDDTSLGFCYIANGSLNIEAEGDGISASAYVQIENGSFDILTGGGSENGETHTSDSFGGFMGGRPSMRPSSSSSASSSSSDGDSGTSIKGIKGSNGILIQNGEFKINSADDAIHANASVIVNGGSFEISTGDDGFHADETLTVTSGTVKITECYEGLEALNIIFKGGDVTLTATDDGLNAAGGNDSSGMGGIRGDQFGNSSSKGSIVISGGNIYINSSGDGIDANGTFEMSGGHVTVCGPTQGDTATLDYDNTATITGGVFIGTGASGMAQTFSSSEQGVISLNVGNQSANTQITLADSDGNVIISHSPELSFAIVILSSPDIITGEKYTVTIGSASSEITAS